jgi:multisubunit Na+/H+ antiporter MnhF subunit
MSIALFLLLTLRGPTSTDRMLTAQLFSTPVVACVLLLAKASRKTSDKRLGCIIGI